MTKAKFIHKQMAVVSHGIFNNFAALSCGILQTGPQNLAKIATENCGPYL